MKRELTKDLLDGLTQSANIDNVDEQTLLEWFREEPGISNFLPDGIVQTDPRDGTLVVYTSARAKRPHDNKSKETPNIPMRPCPICEGNTTGVVDVAALSEGYTFINKNLFPCYAMNGNLPLLTATDPIIPHSVGNGIEPHGFHFLQWTSTKHHLDWHNMPVPDLKKVLVRMGALEKKLLFSSSSTMASTSQWHADAPTHGFVSIIKNYGAPVGGSLAHGHQQITHSNVMPMQAYNNWCFQKQHGVSFSRALLDKTNSSLLIKDYGPARLVVPYFMKRPYNAMLLLCDTSKRFIHEWSDNEYTAVSAGWADAAAALETIMPSIGRETAYNVLVHNGPGAGLYLEFLPFTQETGGLEQMGVWICQNNPQNVADHYRETIQ